MGRLRLITNPEFEDGPGKGYGRRVSHESYTTTINLGNPKGYHPITNLGQISEGLDPVAIRNDAEETIKAAIMETDPSLLAHVSVRIRYLDDIYPILEIGIRDVSEVKQAAALAASKKAFRQLREKYDTTPKRTLRPRD